MAEFTLTDNSANTTTSLLRSLCHYDDSVLMGSWLQETDHKSIEDQVSKIINDMSILKYNPTKIITVNVCVVVLYSHYLLKIVFYLLF